MYISGGILFGTIKYFLCHELFSESLAEVSCFSVRILSTFSKNSMLFVFFSTYIIEIKCLIKRSKSQKKLNFLTYVAIDHKYHFRSH